MKTIALLFTLWSLTSFGQINVINDTLVAFNTSNKFRFERLNKSSSKKVKAGKGISINLSIGDTNVTAYGLLLNANNKNITIIPDWKTINVKRKNYNFNENFYYKESIMIIDLTNVKSIQYDSNSSILIGILGTVSASSALVISPIASIDKNSPNNFNTVRYKTLVFGSLISTAVCIIAYKLDAKIKNKYLLKPKLI
jgi:hypothetical protein